MFEAVQFVESRDNGEPIEVVLGEFDDELMAVDVARQARDSYAAGESVDFAWWVVREKGAKLANFISDSTSDREFVLDLRSGELVEIKS
ncbi:MAG TPA: hypothetical protein VFS66_08190 [Acidimicrobiia bacterium]|nr:hypothetical protein [Acidimicrobiia bacterium]